ncbi:ABC transporter ATP-binding protein [Niveispirillum fermenti]|uniref:ABC transporter ATP-binding protein n=1 Tax=Niveispirillum fermenti TaxID=1233113 RepID=UPI003A83DAB8
MNDQPTVEARGLAKHYGGKRAVHNLDLTLIPGECVALVGHNGAGKSSLIKLMLGLTYRDAGQLSVLGHDPAGRAAAGMRRRIGFLPENVALHPGMTGHECLDFYARLKGVTPAGNAALLARVGLPEAASRQRISTYSKGMRQRLGLAQALLGDPRLLFLDEPTTGLDPALRQGFYAIVRELRDQGVTILLCSHALTELEGQADRVVVMNRGCKVAEGSLDTLRMLADLPQRLTVTLQTAEAATRLCALHRLALPVDGRHRVNIPCERSRKLELIRTLLASDSVTDLELVQPSLDEIYAHFLSREDAA